MNPATTYDYVLPVRLRRDATHSTMTVPVVVDVSPAQWYAATASWRALALCQMIAYVELLLPDWWVVEMSQPVTAAEWETIERVQS